MNKLKLIALALVMSISLTTSNVFAATISFSDLSANHENYRAIQFLGANGIIKGYPDGTFQPAKEINRVELIKIILEGYKIPLGNYDTPFSDVDRTAWYYPYLSTAYQNGWVNGYPDNTFRPADSVNNVEALKIILEITNAQLQETINEPIYNDVTGDTWFSKYVYYAKTKNLIDNNTLFFPGKNYSRGEVSEIIYRRIQEDPSLKLTATAAEIEQTPEQEENFTPIAPGIIAKDFYREITLDENIPNHFYQNEVYIFKGQTTSNEKLISGVLDGNGTQISFEAKVENKRFEVPVFFRKTGNYNLSFILENVGTNRATTISVISELPQNTTSLLPPETTNNFSIDFDRTKTYVNIPEEENTLTKVTFTQEDEEVSYFTRNSTSELPIHYADFADFEASTIKYKIARANIAETLPLKITSTFSESSEKTFEATSHEFSIFLEDEIQTTIPTKLSGHNQNITISGNALVPISQSAYVITPSDEIVKLDVTTNDETTEYFGRTIITTGSDFEFDYNPSTVGTYIIEINDQGGEALINHPVYIGSKIPLIPNYFDLNDRFLFESTFNLNSMRNEWLALVNKERLDRNLQAIEMNESLNELAQAHSQDMADRDFFAHVNLDNETPQDRRIAAGIPTPVSENIAQDISITFGHYSLMRSAAHRSNILNPDWEEVGLGIVEKDGYLILSQEFSTSPLSAEDLEDFGEELVAAINNAREEENLNILQLAANLSSASEYINDEIIINDSDPSNELFSEARSANNVHGRSEGVVRIFNSWNEILKSILKEESILDEWTEMGFNIQKNETGNLYTTVIFNER